MITLLLLSLTVTSLFILGVPLVAYALMVERSLEQGGARRMGELRVVAFGDMDPPSSDHLRPLAA